ncbi:MAG: hypothetical protein IKK18_00380 [Clostridia bacterium]|nr:hypothetical protein [Clostridia bacterium]
MKKLCFLLVAVILSSFLNVYADDQVKFEGKDTLNVVYFGGSITQGTGASSTEKCWRAIVGDWFTKTYPGTKVNNINSAIGGTGTELGYYRARKDVLAHNPDIVFIEFAVNDDKPEQEAQFLLESIIRGFQKSPSNPYIILVYTSEIVYKKEKVDGVETVVMKYKDVSEYQKKIADYYNIPDIDLQPVIEEYLAIEGNVAQGGFFCADDTVHPSDTGYALYAEEIIECLETGNYFKKPDVKETSYVKENHDIDAMDCALPRYDSVYNNSAVKLSEGDWTHKYHDQHGDYMFTDKPGATLEFKFTGPVLGMLSMVSDGGGRLKVEIDGVEVGIKDTYFSISTDLRDPSETTVLGYDSKDLADVEHTLKFTVLNRINPNNQLGKRDISIYGFFTSDGETDGVDKLAVSDVKIMKINGDESVTDIKSLEKGNMNVVEADVKNITNTAINAMCMLAVYDNEGKLVGVNQVKKTFSPYNEETFGIGAIVPDQQNAGCKLFMWDNNFSPIYTSAIIK